MYISQYKIFYNDFPKLDDVRHYGEKVQRAFMWFLNRATFGNYYHMMLLVDATEDEVCELLYRFKLAPEGDSLEPDIRMKIMKSVRRYEDEALSDYHAGVPMVISAKGALSKTASLFDRLNDSSFERAVSDMVEQKIRKYNYMYDHFEKREEYTKLIETETSILENDTCLNRLPNHAIHSMCADLEARKKLATVKTAEDYIALCEEAGHQPNLSLLSFDTLRHLSPRLQKEYFEYLFRDQYFDLLELAEAYGLSIGKLNQRMAGVGVKLLEVEAALQREANPVWLLPVDERHKIRKWLTTNPDRIDIDLNAVFQNCTRERYSNSSFIEIVEEAVAEQLTKVLFEEARITTAEPNIDETKEENKKMQCKTFCEILGENCELGMESAMKLAEYAESCKLPIVRDYKTARAQGCDAVVGARRIFGVSLETLAKVMLNDTVKSGTLGAYLRSHYDNREPDRRTDYLSKDIRKKLERQVGLIGLKLWLGDEFDDDIKEFERLEAEVQETSLPAAATETVVPEKKPEIILPEETTSADKAMAIASEKTVTAEAVAAKEERSDGLWFDEEVTVVERLEILLEIVKQYPGKLHFHAQIRF